MRRITSFVLVVLAGALLSSACGASKTSPDPTAPVRVTVQLTPTFAGGPDIATFTLRVENTTSSVVDLTFPSSCQLLPYFVDRKTGQAVTPSAGGFGCALVITRQTLRAGESFSQVVTVKAGDAPASGVIVLPPGDYAIYARLEDQVYRVKSEELSFSVR